MNLQRNFIKRSEIDDPSRVGEKSWWDWRATKARESSPTSEQMSAALESLAERCVVIDNLSPIVAAATIRAALGQFGNVLGVKLVSNPASLTFIGAAVVEMETREQREQVVKHLKEYLFMVGAMPRPARAIPATPLLLIDHPWRRNPNKIRPRLMKKSDPNLDSLRARDLKARIAEDDKIVLQQIMEREEIQLAQTQKNSCLELMEKLNMIASEQKLGTLREMKALHGMSQR